MSDRNRMRRRPALGFTLIELLIAVAVIGILASIAYPSYKSYVLRSKRAAAQQVMLEISNRQEQYLLDALSYTATLGAGGLNYVVPPEVDDVYDITIAVNNAATPPTYSITATATGSQVDDGNLTLNNLGQKTPANKW